MIKKSKKVLSVVLTLAAVMTMSGSTVSAAESSTLTKPKGMYIRQCVGYEPNYTSVDYTHKHLGSVSGDNRQGSSTMSVTYVYEESSSTSASIGVSVSGSTETNLIFEKMELEVGVEVTGTRSWTKGTSAGVSYGIAPGNFETLAVYIPAVRTAGRLKYKVYMDGYPQNTFYDYLTVTESYAPCKNSVHYKTIKVKKAGLDY